jgi:hypothetical protein
MGYKEVLDELKVVMELIAKYNRGEELPPDFDYKKSLARLSYLRNRKRMFPKGDRGHRQEESTDVY